MNNRKTIAIIGAGPGLGMALARRFGREGYRVGLLARNQQKLDGYVQELAQLGVEAAAFAADVCNRPQLAAAIGRMRAHFGSIDALEYSPMISFTDIHTTLASDAESTQKHLDYQVLGAIVAVRSVVDDMIARGDGILLFTTGASAIGVVPSMGDCSIGVTALRSYAYMLNVSLAPKGVYAGTLCIAAPLDNEHLANLYWDMAQKRDRVEEVYGIPSLLEAFDVLMAKGVTQFYPPKLLQDPPAPRNEVERNQLLLALSYLLKGSALTENPVAEGARINALARKYGGDLQKEHFGARP